MLRSRHCMYRTENAVHACKKILKELYILHVNSEVFPNTCKIEKKYN